MTESFLILHKVRGEPAFDIATLIGEDSDVPIWIIPTSGHRAYPLWVQLLSLMSYQQMIDEVVLPDLHKMSNFPMDMVWIADWPDHYSVNDQKGHEVAAKPTKVHNLSVNDMKGLFS